MNTNYSRLTKVMAAAFISVFTLFSCQKDNNNEQQCSITTANIAGTYKLTALTYKASSTSPEQDYFQFMDVCERDDKITFNTNGTYNYQDVGIVCTPDGDDTGTWSLNGTTITSDGMIAGTVQSFDCSTLIVYVNNIFTAGDKYTFTMKK